MKIRSYKDLTVWQKAMDLVTEIYRATDALPSDERFGLVTQMRRSAVSIPSNIAEGYRRFGRKDYARFVAIAFGSGGELETQIEIAFRLKYFSKEMVVQLEEKLNEVMRLLNGLHRSLAADYSQLPTPYSL